MTKETREQMRVRKQRWIDSLTPERRAEIVKRRIAQRSAKRAAKAILEGRTPGKPGKKAFSPEEKKASLKVNYQRYRNNNLEKLRKRDVEAHKKKRAEKAIAKGRKPGQIGRDKIFTKEEYRARRNEFGALRSRNRRALKKGADGTHTKSDIRQLFFEQNGLCGLCDLKLDADNFHVDHWKPLSKGGSNDKSNLKLLHPTCNLKKSNKLPEELGLCINIRSN